MLPQNSMLTILQSFGIWSKLERWKSSRSECLKNWPQIKNIITFKCCLLLFYAIMNHFSTWLWGAMKSRFLYNNQQQIGQWLDKAAPKHFPKPNLHQKKGHGHCLVVCCLCDPLQLSESQWNHYIWEVCSANQWDALKTAMPAASTDQQKESSSSLRQCLTSHCTTNTSKVEWIGLWSFTSSAIFTCALANWLPLLQASQQHFVGKCLYNQQSAENAFQVLIESWSKAFYTLYYRKNKLISHW